MNKAQFNITSFLENGALLKVAPDQFNLITGPFSTVAVNEKPALISTPLIYQPYFWDFLQTHRQTLFAAQGVASHFLTKNELLAKLNHVEPQKPNAVWETLNSQDFKAQFDWSQQEFASQRLQKTVPIICQKSRNHFSSQNLAWTLKNLLQEDLVGWTYGFWRQGQGYLGQTPELFAEWSEKSQTLKTAAVAGTLKKTKENETQILQDPKIRDEHQFVVEDIEAQLQKSIAKEDLVKKATHLHPLKHLLHLKTDFECRQVNHSKALEIIQGLHPTAALGVYPRVAQEMMDFSKLNLQSERRNFAAPFGFIDSEKILCVAAIRNFFFSDKELQIFSGCGVTSESDYESELSELKLKRDSVKQMMGIFE